MNTIKKNINDLKFHPIHDQIYGADDDISDLKEDIQKSGDVMTLVITPDDVIISGHRRVKACRELLAEGDKRFSEVDCEVREFDSEAEAISYLIRCNYGREQKPLKPFSVQDEQETVTPQTETKPSVSDDIEFSVSTEPVLDRFGDILDGSEDVTFTLCANPKNCAEFEQTMTCFRNWLYYTVYYNKDNFLRYVNKAIEDNDFAAIWSLIQYFKSFCELVEPPITSAMQKISQENKERMELRAKQDAEAKRIKAEYNEQVRRDMMEKSRQASIKMREAEERHKRVGLNQKLEDSEW